MLKCATTVRGYPRNSESLKGKTKQFVVCFHNILDYLSYLSQGMECLVSGSLDTILFSLYVVLVFLILPVPQMY